METAELREEPETGVMELRWEGGKDFFLASGKRDLQDLSRINVQLADKVNYFTMYKCPSGG